MEHMFKWIPSHQLGMWPKTSWFEPLLDKIALFSQSIIENQLTIIYLPHPTQNVSLLINQPIFVMPNLIFFLVWQPTHAQPYRLFLIPASICRCLPWNLCPLLIPCIPLSCTYQSPSLNWRLAKPTLLWAQVSNSVCVPLVRASPKSESHMPQFCLSHSSPSL